MPASRRKRRLGFWRRRNRSRSASMTVTEHLGELRNRLIFSLAAFFLLSVVAFFLYEPILETIRRPLCQLPPDLLGENGCQLNFFRVIGGFMFRLKVTALTGLVFAAPVWLYQIYAFITPGLTSKEKRYAIPFVFASTILFVIGAVLAYLSLPTGLRILVAIGGEGLVPLLGAEEYLNFVGFMFLGFGLMFEVPLVLMFLGLAGVVTVQQLRRQRKTAFVTIVALAAVVTPSQDPYTMLVLAVPIYGLYELTILILTIVGRRKAKAARASRGA